MPPYLKYEHNFINLERMPYSHEESSHNHSQIERLLGRSRRLLPSTQVFPLNFSIVTDNRYLLSGCIRCPSPMRIRSRRKS